jgi:hypothetical protein
MLQIQGEGIAGVAGVGVRVDDRRHHRLAGEVHVPGPGRHRNVAGPTDLRDPRAIHDQCRVLDRAASVAQDDARALERGHAARRILGVRPSRPNNDGKQKRRRDGEYFRASEPPAS